MTAKDAGEIATGSAGMRGRRVERAETAILQEALREASDYRGDVTLVLDDGTSIAGYLFAHEPDAREPHVKLYPADAAASRVVVPIARIVSLEFSGDDKASGRSWEAWVRRYEEKKRLLAQGLDAPDIEPKSEQL